MILNKDNFWLGFVLGLVTPALGMLLFKLYKFKVFTFKETFEYMYLEPGFKTLTVALTLSLLLNALMFTIYVNTTRDKTAKGIFFTTVAYGLLVLIIKTFA